MKMWLRRLARIELKGKDNEREKIVMRWKKKRKITGRKWKIMKEMHKH